MADPFGIFALGFMQRALLAGILVAIAAAVIGTFAILRGMSLLGDTLAHASFGGVALGFVLGLSPFHVALATAIVAAVLIHVMEHSGVVRGDTALGIVFSTGLGVGVVIISIAGGFNLSLLGFLFGSILAITWADVAWFALLVAALCAVVFVFYKEYLYLTFDEVTAQAGGIPVHGLNILFAVLTAIGVVVSIKLVGVLLVSALLVLPAAASQLFARSFRQALGGAILLAFVAALGGVLGSAVLNWPPGGAIAVVSLLVFATALGGRRALSWIRAA